MVKATDRAPAPAVSQPDAPHRFSHPIEREQLQAVHRDGLLTVTLPKTDTVSSVSVQVQA